MRRVICIGLFCVALFLCAVANASAPEVVLPESDARYNPMPGVLYSHNDTLYVLGSDGLYRWSLGASELTLLQDMKEEGAYRYDAEPPASDREKALWEQSVTAIFGEGGTLYAIHTGSGRVFRWGNSAFEMLVALDWQQMLVDEGEWMRVRECSHMVTQEGILYMLVGPERYDSEEKSVVAADLTTGAIRILAQGRIDAICAYEPGSLLLQRAPDESGMIALESLNMVSGAVQPVTTITADTVGGLVYDPASETIYYCGDNEVVAFAQGRPVVASYISEGYATSPDR